MKKKNIEKLLKIAGLLGQLEMILEGVEMEGIEDQIEGDEADEDEDDEPVRIGKRKGVRYTDEQKERVIQMHKNGIGATDIEKKTGVSKATIYNLTKGIAKRGKSDDDAPEGEDDEGDGGFRKL